jgi:hypothetical protein
LPVIASSSVGLNCDPALEARLAEISGDRTIAIDHFASRRCGATIGDLRVRFEPASTGLDAGDDCVELEPVAGVPVTVEAVLLPLLAEGASLQIRGRAFGGRLSVELDRPERWLDFLDAHPRPRR